MPFNGSIDDIYFSFINRYVLNQMCLNEDMSPAEFAPGKEDEIHKGLKYGFDKLFGTGMRNKNVILMSRMQKTDGTSRCFTQIGNIKRQSLIT